MIARLLARGSFVAFLIQGTGAALLLLIEMLVARLLGVAEFGHYALVSAWVYVLGLVGTLGLNHVLLKNVAAYLATEDWAALRGLLRRTFLWAGTAAGALVVAGLVVLWLLESCCIDAGLFRVTLPGLLALPFVVLSYLRQATLRGFGLIGRALLPDFVLRPVVFLGLLGAAVWGCAATLDATTVLTLNLAALALAFAVGLFWQRRARPAPLHDTPPTYRDREWLALALPMFLIVGLNLISSRIDVILLGLLSTSENVGAYAAASRIADVIVFGLASANAIAAPLIAGLHAAGKREELQTLVKSAARGILAFTLPLALGVLVFGREILALFGDGFAAGYPVLAILVAGQLVNALAGPVGFLMTMTGAHRAAVKIVASSALLNLVLNAVLIPLFGMLGAAVATAISTATWNLLMLNYVKQTLALDPFALRLPWRRG